MTPEGRIQAEIRLALGREVRLAVQAASSSLRAVLSVLDTVERTLEGANDDR